MQRFLHFLLISGASLCVGATFLFFRQGTFPLQSELIAQNTNTYLGPHSDKSRSAQELVRVQISVHDDPNPKGVTIESVEYDQRPIPLKPRDIQGFRGQASFQSKPGTYKLRWKVRISKQWWPRTTTHEEEVQVDGRDLWLQISITGDNATIY